MSVIEPTLIVSMCPSLIRRYNFERPMPVSRQASFTRTASGSEGGIEDEEDEWSAFITRVDRRMRIG